MTTRRDFLRSTMAILVCPIGFQAESHDTCDESFPVADFAQRMADDFIARYRAEMCGEIE